MEHGQPSPTAIIAALLRAAHLLLDADPKILRDIDHDGSYFSVRGCHTCEPSPQRTAEFILSPSTLLRSAQDKLRRRAQSGDVQEVVG